MPDEILTIKEVADYLKVAEKTIYHLAGSKKLPGFKIGGICDLGKVKLIIG
jgi:excisionase family DNA binding protein